MAADSRATTETESGGSRLMRCEKMYRKIIKTKRGREAVILGFAGESMPSLLFLDWYGSGKESPRQVFLDGSADFAVLILTRDGLFEADGYCRPERVLEPFYAIGSGAKAAWGAMHAGASARKAVAIACKIDPYSAPPITFMSLQRKPHA